MVGSLRAAARRATKERACSLSPSLNVFRVGEADVLSKEHATQLFRYEPGSVRQPGFRVAASYTRRKSAVVLDRQGFR